MSDTTELQYCTSTECKYGAVCVPSKGPRPAKLAIVCEAPGFREIEAMEPLVGPAGKLFDKFLVGAGLSRSECFLANTCGCCDLSREDRRPLPMEIEACRPRLLADIAAASPKCVVAMGNISLGLFMPGLTISKARGHIRNWNGLPIVATYHPAYALPHRSPQVAPLIIEDLRMAASFINE